MNWIMDEKTSVDHMFAKLHIMPSQSKTFQSSWVLWTRDGTRTFDELTLELCTFERNDMKSRKVLKDHKNGAKSNSKDSFATARAVLMLTCEEVEAGSATWWIVNGATELVTNCSNYFILNDIWKGHCSNIIGENWI